MKINPAYCYQFKLALLLTFLSACSINEKSSNESENTGVHLSQPVEINLDELEEADYELLFIGNSHSSVNGLPSLVATLIKTGQSEKSVNSLASPGWGFLDEKLNDSTTQKYLAARAWSHVILQAQKYSSTGQYWYPTDATEEWIRRVKTQSATPVLFPEWPRRGNFEEGSRVYELHLYIASRELACVAPVGLVWDAFIAQYPNIELYAADGNHSNLDGALLTAYIFYQVITRQSANDLPYIESISVSKSTQEKMKAVTATIVDSHFQCEL
ncbi:hypothetical protein [Aliikangiella sp. IMCC44359]|uniref:hypothetical protein n=1 Tax=Aliikangiella sp. IMCC44359 TaxID=3459125 RepID=UPI00403A804C